MTNHIAISACVTRDFPTHLSSHGTVHSLFERVVNLCIPMQDGTSSRLITLLPEGLPRLPDSIVLSKEAMSLAMRAEQGQLVTKSGYTLAIGRRLKITIASDCLQNRQITDSTPNKTLRTAESCLKNAGLSDGLSCLARRDCDRVYQLLTFLAEALIKCDAAVALPMLYHSVGIGQGLTPASDDMIVGILASLYICGIKNGSCTQSVMPFGIEMTSAYQNLRGRTTDIGLKYICCALEGRFSDALLDVFTDGEDACVRLSGFGHTSGVDMLRGIEIGCRAMLRLNGIVDSVF